MFERALDLDPTFALAHAGIANICAMQYYLKDRNPALLVRATSAVERAFNLAGQLPEAFVALARIRYAQKRYDEAIAAASTAVAMKADCDSSWDLLGRALFASGRLAEAAALTERAIEATGDDYNVYVPYLNALRALGRNDEADELAKRQDVVLERHIEEAPEDTRARILLACDYSYAGRAEEALRQVGMVLAIGTSDPHTIFNIACIYAVLGKKREALDALKRAADAGYGEWESAARDPDLASLHGDPEFERWLEDGRAGG
jgi:tetratricopeptide (TPR) repeat protein